MRLELNNKFNYRNITLILAGVSTLIGVCAAFLFQLGLILLPALIASLALLFLFEKNGKHILTLCVSILIIVVDFIINGVYSFTCLAAVILALVVVLWINRGWSKSVLAATMTAVVSLVIVAFVYMLAFYELKSFDTALANDYISDIFEQAREQLYSMLVSYTTIGANGESTQLFPDEYITEILDQYMNLVFSIVVIISFFIVGLALKLFAAVASKLSENSDDIKKWRFNTSGLFAGFYILLSFVSIFAGGNGVFSLVVLNLYMIFMYVYAYLGFGIARKWLSNRISGRALVYVILFAVLIIFNSISVTLLSYFGAFAMLRPFRMGGQKTDNNTTGNDGGGSSV